MNTFLHKIKKSFAVVFALLMGFSGAACELPFDLPFGSTSEENNSSLGSETESNSSLNNSQSSSTEEEKDSVDGGNDSTDDNTDSGDNEQEDDKPTEDAPPSDEENDKPSDEELQAAKLIMDEAYALATGAAMSGTHTLTGVINALDGSYSSSKGISLYMNVQEPQSREIYCYQLKGVGADLIDVGDTITVQGSIKNYRGTVEFDKGCNLVSYTSTNDGDTPTDENDPYTDVTKSEFYANYTVATSNVDAYYRTQHGFMSGELTVPDQAPTLSPYRPKVGTAYVRNTEMCYEEDGKAYVVTDVYGEEVFTVYKDGAYITLEEVAAYVYAFGTYPKNYSPDKNASPRNSIWAEYLRVNHTSFSGSTSKYPYEPELPNITGCGGKLNYYEMDIGTTGTDCDPSYTAELYNDGYSITRGAARIVYGKRDLDGDGIFEAGEHHVFYTYNHYNDFQEYLNYAGGWGEMFGNITGGGTISSKYDYNPTDYPGVVLGALTSENTSLSRKAVIDRYFGL